jgi:hypothetical protein
MAVTQEQYQSNYGWAMSLPPGFELLPSSPGPVLAAHRPVVFCDQQNYDLWLTWMIAGHPMKEESAHKFVAVTESKRPAPAEIQEIAPTIFPIIGNVDSCAIVKLEDGSRALEVMETYQEEGVEKNGYQLILPLKGVANYPLTFQRICFYAPADDFKKRLPDIRAAARSFHYKRPYGWKSAKAQSN